MLSLLSLPTELLQQIFEEFRWVADDVRNIESFVFCCKNVHHKLKTKLKEHDKLKRNYTNIRLSESTFSPDFTFRSFHPVALLRDLLMDKRTAVYPQRIIIEGSRIDAGDEETEGSVKSGIREYLEGSDDELTARLSECKLFTWQIIQMYKREILQGNKEAIVVVLVCLLPNLKSMSLLGSFATGTVFSSFLDRIFILPMTSISLSQLPSGWAIPAKSLPAHRLPSGLSPGLSRKPLSKLSEVKVACGKLHRLWRDGFSLFEYFATLPNIRSLKGLGLVNSFHHLMFPRNVSEVQTVEFRNSVIPTTSLIELARGAKALKEFTYEHSVWAIEGNGSEEQLEMDDVYDMDFLPDAIVSELREHVASSLTRLDLTGDWIIWGDDNGDGCYIGSLQDFCVLEHIRINGFMFVKPKKGGKIHYFERNGFGELSSDADSDDYPILLTRTRSDSEAEDLEDDPKNFTNNDESVKIQRLVDMLPQSVKTFTSIGLMTNSLATLMLEGLSELKEERVPNLELIRFENRLSLSEHEVAGVRVEWVKAPSLSEVSSIYSNTPGVDAAMSE